MNDWSHGYDVSVEYGHGFSAEMAPGWLDLCARLAGVAPPRAPGAPFRYLDLGVGQGTGLCLLAAANPEGEFVGVDFLPEHIAHARGLAEAAALPNVRFVEGDFIALAAQWPADLGTFDYVALHGVYTWVSPRVRAAVVDCLGHAAGPGGLVYNGYNAQPGWLGTVPFQHVTRLLKETTGATGREAIDASVGLFDQLRAGGAATFQILPGLAARLEQVKTRSTGYLAAEYLGENWSPCWHSEVAGDFARAGLSYVGSATIAETMLPALLPPPLRAPIAAQPDPRLRQDVQDFVINQFFRRDIFGRAPRPAAPGDREVVGRTRLRLLAPPASGAPLEVKTAFGEITLQPPAFAEIVGALAGGPRSINQLASLPGMRAQGPANALQIVLFLLHARALAVAAAEPAAVEAAHRLNAVLAKRAARGGAYEHLAAARLGSAIPASASDFAQVSASASGADSGRPDAVALARWRALGVMA